MLKQADCLPVLWTTKPIIACSTINPIQEEDVLPALGYGTAVHAVLGNMQPMRITQAVKCDNKMTAK